MKVIVSHDVDHLTFWEHKKDLIIPKFFIRNTVECLTGHISLAEAVARGGVIFSNRWHRLQEVMAFDKIEQIPASFFFGVNNGVGLTYNLHDAAIWIHNVIDEGFDVGVHGIDFQQLEDIQKEFSTFQSISGKKQFGIRMHYLRQSSETISHLNKAGYLFDSTVRAMESPYKSGGMWEFPLHIMDGDIIEHGKRYSSKSLKEAQDLTRSAIDQVYEKQIDYLTVLFHDRYFDDNFSVWKDWYLWIIEYLKSLKVEFVGYVQAVAELNNQR
ncbi:MAG: hypothetical protein ACOYMF_07080 [Bacteroidales bacterium]